MCKFSINKCIQYKYVCIDDIQTRGQLFTYVYIYVY